MRIPGLFPIFIFSLTFNKIPWLFPDFCKVWNFPDFSLTAGHPVYGTSTHPTMVTHSSWSWSWMMDSHPFHFMSINPIPQIRLFQTLTLKLQGHSHGWGQRSRSHDSPSIQLMRLFFVSHQSDQPFLRYVQLSVWPWKNTSKIFKENLAK